MESILENKFCKVVIDSKGAELVNFVDKQSKREIIWQKNKKYWKRSSPTLFPYIGCVKNEKYFLDNKEYFMPKHGLVRDVDFELVEKSENYASFLYSSNEKTLEKYPYKFNLYINYFLIDKQLKITYIVENLNNKELFYNIGGHTAYNCLIEKGNKYIEFEKRENKKSATIDLNTGLIGKKRIEVLNNSNKLLLDYNLFKYDTLIFNDLNSNYLILNDPDNRQKIKITFKDFPYLALWTPNAPFICIEPWKGITDSVDSNCNIEEKEGIFIISPDSKKELNTLIEIL